MKNNQIFSNSPNLYDGNKPNPYIYRDGNKIETGFIPVKTGYAGYIPSNEYDLDAPVTLTSTFNISYTIWGDKGEIILLEPGVPSNKESEYIEIQRKLSPFFRTVSIDMLGMGMSDKPLDYGKEEDLKYGLHYRSTDEKAWEWKNDIDYVDQVMMSLFPNEKFTYLASDWAGGIAVHYAAKYNDRLNALILLDPIAFDGYPVNEIQAIGRTASILDDDQFMMAMGAADQTFVQIFKTMVHNPDKVWNQYTLRTIMKTYIDVDYERNKNGENATSMTMRLKYNNLRVLADRSAILSPSLLLPIEENEKGVNYKNITVPTLVIWGAQDNMMPPNQAYRYLWAMPNSKVEIQMVENAGHFVELDQPERVSEIIINFIARELGRDKLADIFLGYTGIWKGDEYTMINGLRQMYKKYI